MKNNMRLALTTLLIVLIYIICIGSVEARPEYMKSFKDFDEKIKKCTLCHIQSSGYGGLNAFGRDFAEQKALTPALMQLDSDGDGYSNIEELKAGSMPGDSASYPGKEVPGFEALLLLAILITFTILSKR